MINFSRRNGKPQRWQSRKRGIEAGRIGTAGFDPFIKFLQLQASDSRLNFGHAPVGAERFVQPAEPGCVFGVDKLMQE